MKTQKHKLKLSLKQATIAGAATGFVVLLLVSPLMRNRSGTASLQVGQEVARLAASIRSHYKMKPDYWGLDSESVLKNEITGELKSILGADIRIGQGFEAEISMPGSKSFDIVYKGLDKKNCLSLLTLKLEEEASLGLISAEIKNFKARTVFTWGGTPALPVSSQHAKDYCLEGSNEVLFRFE